MLWMSWTWRVQLQLLQVPVLLVFSQGHLSRFLYSLEHSVDLSLLGVNGGFELFNILLLLLSELGDLGLLCQLYPFLFSEPSALVE